MTFKLLALAALAAVASAIVSPDYTCGGDKKYTCPETAEFKCCSSYGWCGSSKAFCGNGCQKAFGKCDDVAAGSENVSQDGTCGGPNNYSCKGSEFGDCCSSYGYCGTSILHCGEGCNTKFGTCNPGIGNGNGNGNSNGNGAGGGNKPSVSAPDAAASDASKPSASPAADPPTKPS
ncbi:hypothetical protein MAPG_01865, partial [Magnaporthiopsis poae ATCC 64411]